MAATTPSLSPSLVPPRFPRNRNPNPSSRVAAARVHPEQIEAGEKLRRVALYLLVQGIDAGWPQSTSPSVSSPTPAVAFPASCRHRPASPDHAVHAFTFLVSSGFKWTSPLPPSCPLPCSRRRPPRAAAKARRRPCSGDPFWAAPPSFGRPHRGASDAPICAVPRVGNQKNRAQQRRAGRDLGSVKPTGR